MKKIIVAGDFVSHVCCKSSIKHDNSLQSII